MRGTLDRVTYHDLPGGVGDGALVRTVETDGIENAGASQSPVRVVHFPAQPDTIAAGLEVPVRLAGSTAS
jgi:hypothetical protein